jgi:RimJ/RimL family protein N-acetyltransferase
MTIDLSQWTPRERPQRIVLHGRFVRLEPLSAAAHGDDLFAAATDAGAEDRFRWLPESVPASRGEFDAWLAKVEASEDPLFFAVIDQQTGRALGRQTLMRIDPAHGVIETGNIHWGPGMQRSPRSTEALFLHARHVFDDLGYRRFEWKCNNENAPSKAAALRFGFSFEGIFRNHMVAKGRNRDTAWFAMIDDDWPVIKQAFELWLDPANFASDGRQSRRLDDIRKDIRESIGGGTT